MHHFCQFGLRAQHKFLRRYCPRASAKGIKKSKWQLQPCNQSCLLDLFIFDTPFPLESPKAIDLMFAMCMDPEQPFLIC